MKIYNTLTRKKEEFIPLKKGRVSMYVCGPTVYDEPHIGHARSGYVFDLIRDYLIYRGHKVKFAKNVTDVDDKIIEKARVGLKQDKSSGGDLKELTREIAAKYLKRYYEDMDKLGIKKADFEPKATEYVGKMIDLNRELVEKGFAYVSGGDVYFSVRKFKDYGKLSGQSLDKMESGARVHPGEKKRDPLDFALWKSAKPGEPSWQSPWGQGRPGWHIECSAMSMDILGKNFDIHGGGLDLIFPHHENELAQSSCMEGRGFASYWMHNGLLTIKSEKMAKSLGNFISINEILEKYHPEVLKLFFLSGHYRSPVDFTYEKMEEAKKSRERFYIFFDRVGRIRSCGFCSFAGRANKEIEGLKKKFEQAMDDDFNTPLALGYLHEILNAANKVLDSKSGDRGTALYSKKLLIKLGGIFGLFADKNEFRKRTVLGERVRKAIKDRQDARKRGDYKAADRIRQELSNEGILLEDLKEGTVWRRKV